MTKLTFLLREGGASIVEYSGVAENLRELALQNGVAGISGNCGGFMACATCHVHVAPEWHEAVGPASDDEREMIAMTADPKPESRLGCQVWFTPQLDGLTVRVAAH